MTDNLVHGQILGGVISTPDLDAAIRDYRDALGFRLVERARVAEALARSWDAPGCAGAPMATLQPKSGAHCFIRLVEAAPPGPLPPLRTFGWAAYEINVQEVMAIPERLAGSRFRILGEPKYIPELPYFIAMQVSGAAGEVLYLNEVKANTPDSDLPVAASAVDRIFIAILAAPDREQAVRWYRDRLGFEEAARYELVYDLINTAFDLPPETQSVISLLQRGRMPIVEVDAYPAATTTRPRLERQLPPGNAIVSFAIDSFDAIDADLITPAAQRDEPIYGGRRTATTHGPAGELVELVEVR